MLQYAQEVESLARDGFDWYTYDRAYRIDRGNQPNPPCWSVTNQKLYNLITRKGSNKKAHNFRHQENLNRPQSSFSSQKTQQVPTTPATYCFAFHSPNKRCSRYPCGYNHECHICKSGTHPAYRCRSIRQETGPRSRYPASEQNSHFRPKYNGPRQNWFQDDFRKHESNQKSAPSFPNKS